MNKDFIQTSKYLSYLLRHKPESIGLELDENGWTLISELISKSTLDIYILNLIVQTNDKQRFAISDDGLKIRANQGHTIDIELDLDPRIPPNKLYHGTADRFMDSIRAKGLTKQKRHHVHLTENKNIARSVGARYGKPVVLSINTKMMLKDHYKFYKTINNVWLVDDVPISVIKIEEM